MTKKQVQKVLNRAEKNQLNLNDAETTSWLAKNLARIKTPMNQGKFISEQNRKMVRGLMPGKMFFFGYNPKTKQELMFWDEFPIVLFLHFVQDGFLGLNFHYLPPNKRALFLNNLIKNVNNPNWAKTKNDGSSFMPDSLIKVTYPFIRGKGDLHFFKPCIKRYYMQQITTKIAFIPPTEWKTVPFFPLDRFRGLNKASVWSLAR